jgi:hypothetical protein
MKRNSDENAQGFAVDGSQPHTDVVRATQDGAATYRGILLLRIAFDGI